MKYFLVISIIILSFSLNAKDCSGKSVVPYFSCVNPQQPDVRFYLMEFQTCKNGSITELARTFIGMSEEDIIEESQINIVYAKERILIDPKNRTDSLTFLMPENIVMKDGANTIIMKIKNEQGTFETTSSNGNILSSGMLDCFVNR
jgi:hypothetical protein